MGAFAYQGRFKCSFVLALELCLFAGPLLAHDYTVPFHDCCSWSYEHCEARSGTLPDACRDGHRLVDALSSCDALCCFGHAFFDPCPGILGCPNDNCACEPDVPDTQCIDSDGDGLLDDWEINGVDGDGDGAIDVDLPGMGADPNHKDLFLELDVTSGVTITRAAISAMKAAFAAAPVGAGHSNNPDGNPGINLWVDTGTLSDPTAREDGAGASSCADGLDNAGDGAADGNDPDCLVGDNLGGGGTTPSATICNLNADFYQFKRDNFDARRAQVFRYGVSAPGCDANGDGRIDSGGWGEVGGNDFIEYNHDGGTIMHEFGHNLNLEHGGGDSSNCKPNYVSVMNYDNQLGINQRGGTRILDFSPPRFAGGRGIAPLSQIDESNMNENMVLDSSDAVNRFVFVNTSGAKIQTQLNASPNYNNDADPPLDSNLVVNVDTSATGGGPVRCTNSVTTSQLDGFDDWTNISLGFAQFGDSDSAAINPITTPEPTLTELTLQDVELNTTDLDIVKFALSAPATAGAPLTYVLQVSNLGPNPASRIVVVDTLPENTLLLEAGPECASDGSSTIVCEFEELLAGERAETHVTVVVNPSRAYRHAAATPLFNTVSVENLLGPDVDYIDNTFTVETAVVAAADLGLSGLTALSHSCESQSSAPPQPGLPSRALVEELITLRYEASLTNSGPSSPLDAFLWRTISAPDDSWATASRATIENMLFQGAPGTATAKFLLKCGAPGTHTFTPYIHVRPRWPEESDPNASNDFVSSDIVLDCIVPIKLETATSGHGHRRITRVEVLSTRKREYGLPVRVDAMLIDPSSVRLGGVEIWGSTTGAAASASEFKDVKEGPQQRRDGDRDAIFEFSHPHSAGPICIKGELTNSDGTRFGFFGCSSR